MSSTEFSLFDWISLGGLFAAVVGLPLGLIGAHFHSAVRNSEARAALVQRLTSTRRRDAYHDYLRAALDWLDEKIGPPPFASANPSDRSSWGMKSLSICFALSFGYSVLAYLAGWTAGGPDGLGQVALIEPIRWAPTWVPEWLPRALLAVIIVCVGAYLLWRAPIAMRWAMQSTDRLTERLGWHKRLMLRYIVRGATEILAGGLMIGLFFITALTVSERVGGTFSISLMLGLGMIAASYGGVQNISLYLGISVAAIVLTFGTIWGLISGELTKELALTILIFWLLLPCLNGGLDWTSLSVSRWFGRAIIAERGASAALAITLCLAVADLVAALALAFAVAWLLAFGIEALGRIFDLSLYFEAYVKLAAEAPWTNGLWATFMVLSTLVPTAIHFVLALGAVLMAWSGNPLNRLAARFLASGNEADYLLPQLYLTFGWMLPVLVVPAALIWGLAQLTELLTLVPGPVETLPELLRDTAWHGINTAGSLFGR